MIDGVDQEVVQVVLQVAAGWGGDIDYRAQVKYEKDSHKWTKREAHAKEKKKEKEMRVKYQVVCGDCRQALVRAEVKSGGRSDRDGAST